MKLSKKNRIIGTGEKCPKCGKIMERRGHKERPKQTWYYSEWDVCHDCKHIQHYEEFKSSDWKEQEEQESFFNSI
jgi:hypothetical protein